MSKVYAKPDERGVIVRIDGGYTTPTDLTGWTQIDDGEGDRFNLCQSHYLPDIIDDDGIYNYKLVDGHAVERAETEKAVDRAALAEAERNRPATAYEIGEAIINALNS